MLAIRRLNSQADGFWQDFDSMLDANLEGAGDVNATVQSIIARVRSEGDTALLDYTRQFDHLDLKQASELEIPKAELFKALEHIDPAQRDALEQAQKRIYDYAEKQTMQSWQYTDEMGNVLGQKITAVDRAGIYVPGGTAAYPSSVLMNAVPAKVAGVEEIIMVAPTPGGKINQTVLAAAAVAGVDRVFRIGGAQAIAALAYGTEQVPAVDKIVGPGNIYVATAKRMVFGKVGIDMVAGPSEVLIICDESANPEWIAMDLFSQAEHDVLARSTLLCTSERMIEQVAAEMDRLIDGLERADIARQSIESYGCLVKVNGLAEAAEISNRAAPEHLELSVEDPQALLPLIRHAGAIFMGHHTPEVFGDYCAGPNHVLPTSSTARFSSPLGVYDFQKRSTVLQCSAEGGRQLSGVASILARSEGLTAHARSAEYRAELKD